jgi:hypothetical protein
MSALARKIFSSGKHTGSRHNYYSGMYHNYNYRPNRYGNIKGDVCVNNVNFDGIVYGQFICPIDGFDFDATKCCGNLYEQYCCTPNQVYNSNNDYPNSFDNNKKKNWGAIAGSIIGVVIFATFLIICGVFNIWYCKKRIYNRVPTTPM